MSERTDRELVEQARRGDKTAIGELFSRYWRAARAAAFGVTGEFASAEDAAAEAFTDALTGIDSLRDPERFGFWLRTIVLRKARTQRHRADPTIDPSFADDLSDQNEPPDEALARLELAALVQQAVRELPDPLREAVALVYLEGYDQNAAARFLEIPAGTLRRQLHDGRARLRITIERILQRNKQMNDKRENQIANLETMIESGEIYQALRSSLELRPPPRELIDMLLRRQTPPAGEVIQRLLAPSDRVSDPAHPIGSIAAAIRKTLPEFQDWPLNATAAAHFFSVTSQYGDRLQAVLPPGFAQGRPGAFLRVTRAIVHVSGNGRVESMYEHLQDSPDEQAFRRPGNTMRLSDVIDLTWMAAGAVELRSVQEMLERLTSAMLPEAQVRFSIYKEPRYRWALQLHISDTPIRAACGGVLAEWPGRPNGIDAAHVRIFLEPWATIRSGNVVGFDSLLESPLR